MTTTAQERIKEVGLQMHSFGAVAVLCIAVAILFLGLFPCQARLGETPTQCSDRYGKPLGSTFVPVLIEKAIHRTYVFKGWRITAAFLELDGPAVRVEYQKIPWTQIQDYEIEAILKGESDHGASWTPLPMNNPFPSDPKLSNLLDSIGAPRFGQRVWLRSDGAIAWLRGGLVLRLELPAAREYEAKLKQEKETKARASVPTF